MDGDDGRRQLMETMDQQGGHMRHQFQWATQDARMAAAFGCLVSR
jgi:hypothetical protein